MNTHEKTLRQRLEQYRYSMKELDLLRGRLAALPITRTSSTVLSSDGPGCTQHEVTVRQERATLAVREIQHRLRRREQLLLEECRRIERYIDGIADSRIRQIITLRYVEGRTWQRIAFIMGYRDEGTPRKKAKEFLALSENSENPMVKL